MQSSTKNLRLEATVERDANGQQRTTHSASSSSLMQGTWIRKRKIGKGGFGTVWLENHLDSSRAVAVRAVKQIWKTSLPNGPERELQVMAKFSQEETFITCYGWYEYKDSFFIAMQYCEHGDLSGYLDERGPLPETTAQSIIYQVLEGLVSMHKNKYAHRDLKPLNLLVTNMEPLTVKITDFGFSKPTHDQSGYSTFLGTQGFIAPEVGLAYDGSGRIQDISPFPVDMWCLGETTVHILANRSCFNDSNTFRGYRSGTIAFPTKRLEKEGVTPEGIDFVCSLMRPDPSLRMTAQEATEHKWTKSGSKPVAKPKDTENHNTSAWTETSTSAFDDSYSSHSSPSPGREPSPVKEPSPVEERSWSQEVTEGAERFHDYLHGDDYGSTGFYGSGTFD